MVAIEQPAPNLVPDVVPEPPSGTGPSRANAAQDGVPEPIGALGHHSRTAVVRRVVWLVGGAVSLGWLVALGDAQRRAVHDRVAGTLVVARR